MQFIIKKTNIGYIAKIGEADISDCLTKIKFELKANSGQLTLTFDAKQIPSTEGLLLELGCN